ncbi:Protein HGH1 [Araneus ventricosus]|uniref:Protein HGH1 homolog n=1 Tax=Araneus ventricosus TaxID=182803 RepID=A0A4Y2ES46_ARAVE|nr:Protein HGH1 [Araneus ventricosus]
MHGACVSKNWFAKYFVMETEVHEDLLEILQNPSLRLGARICGFEYLLGAIDLSGHRPGIKHCLYKLLIKSENFITSFIHHVNFEEPYVRRMGVAVTLRNICSEPSVHKLLIEKDVLSILLLPLMGPEDYDDECMEKLPLDCQYLENSKQREPVPQIRRALIQALSLLCYTEDGWNCLVNHAVYFVARDLHKSETDATTKEAVETLVGFLLIEKYSGINTVLEGNEMVTPSVTEIVKDVPDFIVV